MTIFGFFLGANCRGTWFICRVKRVISLLPSCTEIICALHGANLLVGRSHCCDAPEVSRLPVCTSGPNLEADFSKLSELNPDVVFSLVPLPGLKSKVVEVNPKRLSELWSTIQLVADALDQPEAGRELVSALKNRLVDVISKTCMLTHKPTVCCLGWLDPMKVSGMWVPDMVELAGGQNLFSQAGKGAVDLDWETLVKANPQVILLMPCGMDIESTQSHLASLEQRPEWRKINAVKHKKLFIVDATRYFSRPSPGLIDSEEILAEILHPNLFRFGGEGKQWRRV